MNQPLKQVQTSQTEGDEIRYLVANDLQIAYDEFGQPQHPAILLIMGLGTQMIAWPDAFCRALADAGQRVIRFDNRDIGLSEKIKVIRPVSIPRIMLRSRLGLSNRVPYRLHDMALDAVGVLDALEIDAAHIVGASMGGMIAQIVAAEFPARCQSLTSIMSTTGNPALPAADWRVTKQLLMSPRTNAEAPILAHMMKTWRIIGSPDFPPSDDELRERILIALRRSYYPAGYRNQLAAIIETGDRRQILSKITARTLVIHGKVDSLVPVDGGIDTAKHIRDAQLELIDGMGHDLPKELLPRLVQLICTHTSVS